MSSSPEEASLWIWIALTTVFVYRGAYHLRDAQLMGYERDWTEDDAKTPLTGAMPAVAGGFLAAAERCGSWVDSGMETGGAGGASGSDVGTGDGGGVGRCEQVGDTCASGSFCTENGDGA